MSRNQFFNLVVFRVDMVSQRNLIICEFVLLMMEIIALCNEDVPSWAYNSISLTLTLLSIYISYVQMKEGFVPQIPVNYVEHEQNGGG